MNTLKFGVALVSLSISACMYPGMDKEEKFGAAVKQTMQAQVENPNAAAQNGDKAVSGTHGQYGVKILEQHRTSIDSKKDVNSDSFFNDQ